jgi:glycosyltransferase involved in cell wall biosynthesis
MFMQLNMYENSKKISICAITPYPYNTTPAQRFRVEQWEPYLEKEGITIDYYAFANEKLMQIMPQKGKFLSKVGELTKAFARRISHLSALSKYDVIFIHRAATMVGPAIFERFMKMLGRPIIFEFDDAIFMPHTADANRLFGWLKFAGKTASICRLSSSVIVGNAWLAEYALKYNPNTFIVPTSIDTETYKPGKREKNDKIIVGWTGSSTSQTHLEMFEPTLVKLLEKHDVEIRVISNREPSFKTVPFIWREWSPETEITDLIPFDIGIMPNPLDEWSKGKCALKALQYMSMGIPTICSDIGANREVIQNGENGFLAKTEADWLEQLEKLILDEKLRQKIGQSGRTTVVEKYSMTKCAELFKNVIIDSLNFNNRKEK